jgi:hypothetical protein
LNVNLSAAKATEATHDRALIGHAFKAVFTLRRLTPFIEQPMLLTAAAAIEMLFYFIRYHCTRDLTQASAARSLRTTVGNVLESCPTFDL